MFTTLALAAALAAPVPKAAAPDLKWKLAKGDTFYVTTNTESAVSVNGGGVGAQANTSVAVFAYQATVASADEKGATLEVVFLTCKSGTGVGGAVAKLDDQAGVVGKKMTFTLDADRKVTKADGVVALGNAGGIFSGEYVQSHIQDVLRAVPGKPLGKGETWTAEEELPLTDGIVCKRKDSGSVVGTEDGLTKLEVDTDNAMTGGKGGVKFDLKGDKGKRTVLFDPKAGRVRKLDESYTVAGSVDVGGGGGGAQAIQLTMTMKAAVSVSDEKPKDGK
jgi:hypothetical protein